MRKEEIRSISFNLPVSFFMQGSEVIAYTPALDISTYGKSKADAQKNFEELVDTFFESFDDARELRQVLESLGWTKQKSIW